MSFLSTDGWKMLTWLNNIFLMMWYAMSTFFMMYHGKSYFNCLDPQKLTRYNTCHPISSILSRGYHIIQKNLTFKTTIEPTTVNQP